MTVIKVFCLDKYPDKPSQEVRLEWCCFDEAS